jgi:cysteine-rich repeat protein
LKQSILLNTTCEVQVYGSSAITFDITTQLKAVAVASGKGNSMTLNVSFANPCGDSIVTGTEECDDGNTNDTDGCTWGCTVVSPAM